MILVHDPSGLASVQCLGDEFALATVRDRDELLRRLESAVATLACVGGDIDGGLALIDGVRRRAPTHPIVLIASLSAESARRLAFMASPGLTWIVWDHESRLPLRRSVLEAVHSDPLARAYSVLTSSGELSPVIESALRRILIGEAGPSTARSLAAALGVPESTLHYHWSQAFPGCSLKRMLDWVALVRATRSGSVRGLGARCPTRRLDRVSRRLVGRPFEGAERVIVNDFDLWLRRLRGVA